MALFIRNILRQSQTVSETILFPNRTVLANIRRNNTAEQKADVQKEAPPIEGEAKSEFEQLNKQVTELKEQNADLLDKYKRALAESENMRSRLTKQISEAKVFGIQSFCKDLVDVADVLHKATETVPKEEISDKNPHLKSLYEGLMMTEAQLKSVFKRHGLEQVNPLDEKFNPNYHEALFQQVYIWKMNI
nr:unnamed protein product [Callosobruchus analis]